MVRLRRVSSDPWALALAAIVLGSALASIEAAGWVEELPPLTLNGLGAMLLAWALLVWGIPRYLSHGAAFLIGALAVLKQVTPILVGEGWLEQMVDLATRLNAWAYAARIGGISTDPLAFYLLLLAFAWVGGYAFSWSVSRGRCPWWPMAACAVALLMNLNYGPSRLGFFFLIYTLSSLLLVVRLNYSQAPLAGNSAGGGRFFLYSAFLAFSLSLVAGFAPTPGESPELLNLWYKVNTPWQEGLGQLNRLFAFLVSKERPGPGAFDKVLVLRGTSNLSDDHVMLVESSAPRYWRALSYDYYTGQGWLVQEQTPFRARSPVDPQLLLGQYQATREVTQTVTILSPKNNLVFAAGQARRVLDLDVSLETSRRNPAIVTSDALARPEALSEELRPYADVFRGVLAAANPRFDDSLLLPAINGRLPQAVRVTGMVRGDGGRVSALVAVVRYPIDVTALYAASPLQIGQRYTVVSAVSEAAPERLREAGVDYPAWVAERYLQLPLSLPERVRALSRSLTESADNPYDKAVALEGYLRGLSYATSLPVPSGNMDRVDYMLFTLRKGYSAYFSTAMTVMLRAVGIPARVVTGYATGDYDPERGAYLVKESNAHGWVEAFFPQYGWIEFEPTPGLPSLARVAPPAGGASEGDFPFEGEDQGDGLAEAAPIGEGAGGLLAAGGWPPGAFWLTPLLLAAAGLWLAWRRRWAGLDAAVVVYGKISFLSSLARLGPRSNQTPGEYGRTLQDRLPGHERAMDSVLRSYESVRYGGAVTSSKEAARLFLAWRALRPELLRFLWQPGGRSVPGQWFRHRRGRDLLDDSSPRTNLWWW